MFSKVHVPEYNDQRILLCLAKHTNNIEALIVTECAPFLVECSAPELSDQMTMFRPLTRCAKELMPLANEGWKC